MSTDVEARIVCKHGTLCTSRIESQWEGDTFKTRYVWNECLRCTEEAGWIVLFHAMSRDL